MLDLVTTDLVLLNPVEDVELSTDVGIHPHVVLDPLVLDEHEERLDGEQGHFDAIVSGSGHLLVQALPLIDIQALACDCGEAGLGQDPDLANITGISRSLRVERNSGHASLTSQQISREFYK